MRLKSKLTSAVRPPRWERRYTLRQLLTPGFVIGNSDGDALPVDGVDGLIYDEAS